MPPASLAERLQADLLVARKARDQVAVEALRTALAALANAEAPAFDPAAHAEARGALREHARLELDDEAARAVLRAELDRRAQLVAEVGDRAGSAYVAALQAEAAVLRRYLPEG